MKKIITTVMLLAVFVSNAQKYADVGLTTTAQPKISTERLENSYANPTEGGADSKKTKLKKKPNRSKLVQKADLYFDKMWYALAAELYEEALAKGEDNYSFDIIQKAADAHYFNTNMEKAHEWYSVLYENYGKEMSTDNMFKYAHALKGIGKYARSKRILRIYNRKMDSYESNVLSSDQNPTTKETILDGILNKKRGFDIKNLGINSEYSEFSPMFSQNNRLVFASAKDSSIYQTIRYKWNDQPYLDLYEAEINTDSQDVENPVKLSKHINTKYHDASATFSPDKSIMYFTRNNYNKRLRRDKNGINHLKIYVSKKVDGAWTNAIEVPFNSDDYSTGHPALSPDGKQLYFVSDMPGTIGRTDIFVVDVLEYNTFSEPKNLGAEINTDRKELFPFLTGDKLYFSSDGHVGLGGLDVFEVAYDAESGFGTVTNIGQPINSNKDDFSYIVDKETQKGFFASNRQGGKGDDDIYAFAQPRVKEAPENLNAIEGLVTELITGQPIPNASVLLFDENEAVVQEIQSDESGKFLFENLNGTAKYTIKVNENSYFESVTEVVTKDNQIVRTTLALNRLEALITLEDGVKKLKTERIHFDFDKHYIRQDAAVELDKLVEVMTEYKDMVIKIESHTDSRGSKTYNKYLSDKRAKSSRDYLIEKGISADRIESATGYGEERLLNECDGSIRCTKEEHFNNRRSEFIIVSM